MRLGGVTKRCCASGRFGGCANRREALGNIVEKTGAWYNYKSTRLGQGRENAKFFLTENKDLAEEIRQAVLTSKGLVNAKKALDTPLAADDKDAGGGEA